MDHGYKRPYGNDTLEGRGRPWELRVALQEACQEVEGPCGRFQGAEVALQEAEVGITDVCLACAWRVPGIIGGRGWHDKREGAPPIKVDAP